MSKKLIAFFLALVMVLTMLAACGDEGTVYVPLVSPSNGGNKAPAVEEDGKLRIGISQSAIISSYTDNDFTRWIEEQLGIEIEFVYYSSIGTEAYQQFALDCAAEKYDDMPDVIWGFNSMSRDTLGDLGEDGYIMDLTPYLNEEHFPNFMKALEKVPQRDKQIALEQGINTDDGGYYGLPRIANEGIDGLDNMVFINEEWLENLGLEKPTTPDELYTVLKAFRDEDPNGNGKKDELPMVGQAASCNGIAQWVMNAFCYWDLSNPYNVMNGQIYTPFCTDQFREGLKFLNKLYEEGLLAEMSLTSAFYADFIAVNTPSNNIAKAGIWIGHPNIYTDPNTAILDQYTVLESLQDASGNGFGGYTVCSPSNIGWCSWICAHTQRPNTAMRFLDLMYTDEAMTRMRYGEKGIYWDYGTDEINYKGEKTNIHVYDDSAFFGGNSTWGMIGNGIQTDANATCITGNYYPGTRNYEVERLTGELWDNVYCDGRRPDEVAQNLVYSTEDSDRRNTLIYRYTIYYTDALTLFITGKNDVSSDTVWYNYLNTLDSLGRLELEGITQRAYDRQQSEQ